MVKIALWAIGGFAAFLILGNLSYESGKNDPKWRAREVIALCWSDQAKKSNTPDVARFIAGACEAKEAEFRKTYGVNP